MLSNRRDFLRTVSLAGGIMGLSPLVSFKSARKAVQLGIIENTFRGELEKDYRTALREIARIGYTHIESGVPVSCPSAAEFKAALNDYGLMSIGPGASIRDFLENLDELLRVAEILESPYVVCYYPWLSSAKNLNVDEVIETADRINHLGRIIRKSGFRFAWHNHAKEFANIDHRQAIDILLEKTDPEYSTVELDWYWATVGGRDPVTLMKKYPGRFELAHLRDRQNNRHGGSTCPGLGLMDFEPIIRAARTTGGTKHFIVEHPALDGIHCARVSYNYLNQIM